MLGGVPIVEHVAAKTLSTKKPCQLNLQLFLDYVLTKQTSIVK
jgi:hypothetical protein